MVWTAYTTSRGIWWAHRILIGLVVAPVESLPEVSVPDLFFAHERGNYMGFYTFVLFGSNALAPLLAGFITKHLEWKAAIWFGTIVVSVTTVIIFFGMEETIYFRSVVEGINDEAPEEALKLGKVDEANASAQQAGTKEEVVAVDSDAFTEPPTYAQKLKLFRLLPNRPTVKQMWVMMYRPLQIFFLFPNVVWAGFLYGASLCLYQIGNATVGFVLGGPGYGWASDMVGLSYIAGKSTPVLHFSSYKKVLTIYRRARLPCGMGLRRLGRRQTGHLAGETEEGNPRARAETLDLGAIRFHCRRWLDSMGCWRRSPGVF